MPQEGRAGGAPPAGSPCPDCGAVGADRYCGACGRPRVTGTPTTRELLAELFSELGGVERRLLRTAEALFLRPGLLTLEYREGRGSRYVSPVRVYLIASALYFLSDPVTDDRLSLGWIHLISDEGIVAPTVVVLLAVPILAMVLWGVFHRARRPWSEHLVAALYIQSFLFLLWIVSGSFRSDAASGWEGLPIGRGVLAVLVVLVAVVYVGEAARRLWTRRRITAYLGGALALAGYSILTGLGFLLLLAAIIGGLELVGLR